MAQKQSRRTARRATQRALQSETKRESKFAPKVALWLALLLVGAGLAYVGFATLSPPSTEWLQGQWKYQGEDVDYLNFRSDGSVQMRDAEKIYARCAYLATRSREVAIQCSVNGQARGLKFSLSEDGKTLRNTDQAESVYQRIGD